MTTRVTHPPADAQPALWRSPVLSRSHTAVVLTIIGLAVVGAGAQMPWVTVFHGLQPIPGFRLDGGDLAGVALACAALLAVAVRHGGARILRPLAATGAVIVVAGSLNSAHRIAAYVADPGPAGALVAPTGGVGPLVMAAGGVTLLAAVLLAPTRAGRMGSGMRVRVLLAAATFFAAWMHLVLTPEHMNQSTLLGLGFLAAGLVQIALSVIVVERPSDGALSLLVMVSVALLAVWAYAVLVGLPLGEGNGHDAGSGLVIGAGEPIDLSAAITKFAELASLSIALVLMRSNARSDADSPAAQRPWVRRSVPADSASATATGSQEGSG